MSAPTATKPMLHIMDRTGDTRLEWNPNDPVSVASAKAGFDAAKAKGYYAYRTRADGSKGEIIHEFDPNAEKIIMAPQIVGG